MPIEDQSILQLDPITSPLAGDYLVIARVGSNKRILASNLLAASTSVVNSFHGRQGAVTLISSDLNGLSGAGLSGIGTGTGGIINTGTTTIGADSDSDNVGVVALQTRTITRFQVNNDGTLTASGTKLTIGNTSIAASARIDLTTRPNLTATAGRLWNWYSETFGFTNGPGGETNYDDDTQGHTYNTGTSGAKIVGGLVNFGWHDEARFYQEGEFQSEHYFSWLSPDGSISLRPFSYTIQHDTGRVRFGLSDDIYFLRRYPDNDETHAIFHGDIGLLDFQGGPSTVGGIRLKNDSPLKWGNAAGDSTIFGMKVNASNQIIIAPEGDAVIFNNAVTQFQAIDVFQIRFEGDEDTYIYQTAGANTMSFHVGNVEKLTLQTNGIGLRDNLFWFTDNTSDLGVSGFRPRDVNAGRDVIIGGVYKVGANQVVGAQGAAVADATDATTVITQLNTLLSRLRTHGLIST
jgi:hypothetical protein